MEKIFDKAVFDSIMERVKNLKESNPRQWGKMDIGQMLAHVNQAIDMAFGEIKSTMKPGFFMKYIVKPFVLKRKPFGQNLPTSPDFMVTSSKDFEEEKQRLINNLNRIMENSKKGIWHPHPAFGELKHDEWGILFYKHIDHHLRQFSA